jgi:hypothetical protein
MTKSLTTRSLLLAGALAFAALPALAQTAPATQSAAPAAGSNATPGASTDMGTGRTATSKPTTHIRKIASAHKSNVHRVSTKKHTATSKTQKPTGGSSTGTGTGTGGTQPQ